MEVYRVIVLVVLSCFAVSSNASYTNNNVDHRLVLSPSGAGALVPRVKVEVSVTPTAQSKQPYVLLFSQGATEPSFGTLTVSADGKKVSVKENCNEFQGLVGYTHQCVFLDATVGGEHKLIISYVPGMILKPFPTEISQLEHQLLRLADHPSLWLTPYETTTQTLTISLPSKKIESYTKKDIAVSRKDKVLVYGPFKASKPLDTGSLISVHFESNSAQKTFTTVEREVEISLWGNIAFEEHHNVRNDAASLKGGFSRLDYQEKQERAGTLAGGVWIPQIPVLLPNGAESFYYRDQIGNISTSTVQYKDNGVMLNLKPRFPLFGGWRTNYYFGYSMNFESLGKSAGGSLTVSGSKYEFSYQLQHTVPDSYVEQMSVKFVLPEGVENVQVSCGTIKSELDKRYTFLDSIGRTTVELTVRNLSSKSKAIPVKIQFEGSQSSLLWRKPMLLSASFMTVYALYIVMSRVELGIKI